MKKKQQYLKLKPIIRFKNNNRNLYGGETDPTTVTTITVTHIGLLK